MSKNLDVLLTFESHARTFEPQFTAMDQAVGDGDFGVNLRLGMVQVRERLDEAEQGDPLQVAADVFLDEVGGTSGPLFGVLFANLARAGRGQPDEGVAWQSGAWEAALAIERVGGAREGDRTMMDALIPAARALTQGQGFTVAAEVSAAGATATKDIVAKRGRSSYLGERALGVSDPGAVAVALLFKIVAHVFEDYPLSHEAIVEFFAACGTPATT